MPTKRNHSLKKRGSRRMNRKLSGGKTGKKWTTAIEAAHKTLSKTGSISAARQSLKKQALTNARKLFGSI